MDDKTKKKFTIGVTKALKCILDNVDECKEKYPHFTDAIISNMDDKTKEIYEAILEENGKDAAHGLLLNAIKSASSIDILKDLMGEIFGLEPEEIKEAIEYAAEKTRYHSLLKELSDVTSIRRSDLILSFDYSKELSERVKKLEIFLGKKVKEDTEG